MKFKKILVISSPLIASFAALSTISCSKARDYSIKLDFSKPIVEKYTIPVKIVENSDGDTAKVQIMSDKLKKYISLGKGDITKVRIFGVDTPEKAVGTTKSDPEEYKYAAKASEFCSNTLKVGEQYLLFLSSYTTDTFGRLVGDFFFKKNPSDEKYLSYSVEITRSGWTLPHTSLDSIKLIDEKYSLSYYTLLLIAYAMEDAAKNKAGAFKDFKTPYYFSQIYKLKPNSAYTYFLRDNNTDPTYVFQYEKKAYPNLL